MVGSYTLTLAAALFGSVWPVADGTSAALRDLGDPSATKRAAAVVRLVATGRPDLLPAVRGRLDDDDATVRAAAARALVAAGDEPTMGRIVAAVRAPQSTTRIEALTALRAAAKLPSDGLRAAERALGDADASQRLAALAVLASHPRGVEAPTVSAVMRDSNRDVRLAAVRVLGLSGDARALVPLLRYLEDGDRSERAAIAAALGDLGDQRAGAALLRQIDDDGEDVRGAAVDSLGRLRFAPAVPSLRALARRSNSLGRRAAIALGKIADVYAIDALIELLQVAPVRPEVVDGLRMAGAAAVGALARVVQAGSSHGAVAAVRLLGAIGDPGAVDVLSKTVIGKPLLALSAANALKAIRSKDAVPTLMLVAADRRSPASVRETCLDALSTIADDRAVSVVDVGVTDTDPLVRAAALRLAAEMGDGLSYDQLTARLNDEDVRVRWEAVRASGRIRNVRALPLLLAKLDRDPAVARDLDLAIETSATPEDAPLLIAALRTREPLSGASQEIVLRALVAALALSMGLVPDDAQKVLTDILGQGGSVAELAATALGHTKLDRTSVRTIAALWPQLPVGARAALCGALGRADDTRTDDLLVAVLDHDPEPAVRAAAAWSAGRRAMQPQVSEALMRAERDNDDHVAANARAARNAEVAPHRQESNWVALRIKDPDGSPARRRWIQVRGERFTVWAATSVRGELRFGDLPPGPYEVVTAGGVLIATGREPLRSRPEDPRR